jgi:hypothetical protein
LFGVETPNNECHVIWEFRSAEGKKGVLVLTAYLLSSTRPLLLCQRLLGSLGVSPILEARSLQWDGSGVLSSKERITMAPEPDPKGERGGDTGPTKQKGTGQKAEKGDQRREKPVHSGPTRTGNPDTSGSSSKDRTDG